MPEKVRDRTRGPLKYLGLVGLLGLGAGLLTVGIGAMVHGSCFGFKSGFMGIACIVLGAAAILAAIAGVVVFAWTDRKASVKRENESAEKERRERMADEGKPQQDPAKLLEQLQSILPASQGKGKGPGPVAG